MSSFAYDDNVRRFKEMAKQYSRMQDRIVLLREEIRKIDDRMLNFRSPSLDRTGSSPSRHEPDIVGMIQKKTELEKEAEAAEAKCEWIRKCIGNIQSPYNRSIASMLYLDGYSISDISQEYEITPQHVFSTTKDSLGTALTEELMLELLMLEKG